jgi:hypothetical protein
MNKPDVIGLGDIVTLSRDTGNPYSHCTVCKVNDDGTVNLFRPYTHTADFSYTGGVICYVGIENMTGVNPAHLKLVAKGPVLR